MLKKIKNDAIFKHSTYKSYKPKRLSKKISQKKKNEYNPFFKFSLVSVFLIFSFYSLPNVVDYLKDNFFLKKNIINLSQKKFQSTLKNKSNIKNKKIDEISISENIFDDIDIFLSDENNNNTTRLSASTIEQVFEDTNYNLKRVKETKLVNIGNSLDHLPKEMKNIENVKKRKDLFIKIVLPLIIEENTKIKLDRKRLFVILNKNNNSKSEKNWLRKKFKQYGVVNNDLSTLKIRMDEIPVSIALAQAAKETGWGTSRFAIEGNALFGQWTYSENGIKPSDADSNSTHKVMKFKVLKASVRAYQRNLNTHSSYRDFRKERAIQRDNDGKLNSLGLVKFLNEYAETGLEYTIVLKKIIVQNSLTDFDDAKILPTSKKIKNLI